MSKGGSTTSKTEIPAWLEGAAIENINKARGVSELGYVPYYGPDVAAFSPMQQQSMQSTGNAASAFGLAPQGFDAMAGMPQAQSFAGGIQGYSSAPLYEESLAQLQQKRPAQYKAMTDMFIDPFTGARPSGDYTATPAQVEQMFSNSGGGGGIPPTGGGGNRSGNNDGEYFGVNSQYNPYGYSTPTENISGEKDRVADYRDMSFGEDGRRDIPWSEKVGDFLNPFSGIEKGIDVAGGLLFDHQGKGDALMTEAEAINKMNSGADRYENRVKDAKVDIASDYGTDYGSYNNWDFDNAVPPTIQVEEAAAPTQVPDYSFPMGTKEDLSQVAQATPYAAPQISNPVIESQNPVMKGLLADQLTSEYDLQTGLQDEIAQDAKDAADKALKAKQANDAVLAKAKAKKMAADKAKAIKIAEAKAASDAKIAEDAEAKAVALVQKQLDDEAAAKAAAKKKADATAAKKKAADKLIKDAEAAAAKAAAKAAKGGGGGGGNNTWSPPKNNGYAGQSGKKSTKGKAKTGYSFGL